MVRRLRQSRKGQSLVEYALLIAGVALVATVGVVMVGEKTADMIAAVATVLPSTDADDNGPIGTGKLIETTDAANGPIGIDLQGIVGNNNTARLGKNITGSTTDQFGGLVTDPAAGS